MGLMQGKFQGDSIIVMDAFALPVEGTETRVNAQADAYEYMVEYSTINKQTIPHNKIEDFGVHCKQYYSLDITYFKSSLDSHLLDLLWNKYRVNTLSSSPLLGNRDYVGGQIFDLVPTHLVLSDVDQFDTILDMEKDELAREIEEEEEGEIEYVEGDDIEMGDMDDMEDFEGFGDEDDNVKKLYIF
ncbi:COP9 signalosome complex subunit 5b [Hordeum vulgare]|nr:COP9 signalosome complex subunit 5b [Hordeum vulgare]